ncbi:hypothetical protein L596_026930 [Steinernema carpocapsae]|uniref:Uncharacterized protein n=1 Tax=Steinernema carpocapsae TaxID=34508 RepID=A0A4U5M2W2_STECR|nr:hypothetical protein L596_026930 [Steinernema carpocapsae]
MIEFRLHRCSILERPLSIPFFCRNTIDVVKVFLESFFGDDLANTRRINVESISLSVHHLQVKELDILLSYFDFIQPLDRCETLEFLLQAEPLESGLLFLPRWMSAMLCPTQHSGASCRMIASRLTAFGQHVTLLQTIETLLLTAQHCFAVCFVRTFQTLPAVVTWLFALDTYVLARLFSGVSRIRTFRLISATGWVSEGNAVSVNLSTQLPSIFELWTTLICDWKKCVMWTLDCCFHLTNAAKCCVLLKATT